MQANEKVCQSQCDALVSCSQPLAVPTRGRKLWWYIKSLGLRETLGIIRFRMRCAGQARLQRTRHPSQAPAGDGLVEAPHFQPGELVRVRSEDDILRTLDRGGRNKGLLWMPIMRKYCGSEFRLYKRVDTILLESTGELRKLKNTVLLEGALCDGLYGCDRACFHFWREAWLQKVNRDSAVTG